jgi:hypothetical protein
LQNKFAPISKAIFREQQALRYPNTISISNEPSLGMLIANNKETSINSDSLQSYSLARNQLLTIADNETTDYILDRLDDEDIQNLNQKFPSFIKTLTEKYKNIDKNKFIELIKTDTTVDIDYSIKDRGAKRINREKTDAEVRKKIIEDRDDQLRSERFPLNTINRDQFEEYQYDDESVTPTQNPEKNKTSSFLSKTVYGKILNQELYKPSTEMEAEVYQTAFKYVSSFKDKRALGEYISTQVIGKVPQKFSKPDLFDIALKLRLKEELSVARSTKESGSKRLIEGRGFDEKLSRNPDKVILNNGKFIIDMEKLRRNILSVSYASCRASIPQLKKENVSNDVKNILKDIIEKKYNANLFNKMKSDDQRIVSTFVRMMKIPDIDMKEFDEAYQLNYEILLGQVNSGQNNPIVKRELKEYILRAISEGLIPKSQGYNKLFELSL